MQIHLAKSDITTLAVDAVVNPANSMGIMGGGVAAALSRKGGPSIQKEAMSLAPDAAGGGGGDNAGQRGGGAQRGQAVRQASDPRADEGAAGDEGRRRERPARDARGAARGGAAR